MNLISVEGVSKTLGDVLLFENLSFGLEQGQKVALIARNGTGKTTLLNILAGEDTPDTGNVTFRQGLQMAYLRQDPALPDTLAILEVLTLDRNPLSQLVSDYESALSINDSDALHLLTSRMDDAGAWDYEARVREVLGKLGFKDFQSRVGTLSGGQKKKLALARVLLSGADVLILDEPTNHLDIVMTEWLEGYISRQKLSLILVSHDRYFIDNVCSDIFELDNQSLYRYRGNYSYFLVRKAEREEAEAAGLEKTRNRYRTELEWMRRMPQARTTKQKARIEAFYDLEEHASRRPEAVVAPFSAQPQRMGHKILELNYVCKSFGPVELIRDFSHTFKRGEKIGLVGPNGTGKTTLLNMIMGQIRPDKGSIVKGETVIFGYFRQEGLMPDTDKRVLEIVKEVAEEIKTADGSVSASQFLHYFGFSYTTQHNYYSKLSGGEKRKLHLLITLIQNPNFLILDEPTNDLDIFTLNRLEDFIDHFAGCVLVVSHDRFFIDRVAEHLFVFEGNGKVSDFPGTYTEYIRRQASVQRPKVQSDKPGDARPEKLRILKGLSYKQKQELEALEKEIQTLENKKSELTCMMQEGSADHSLIGSWAQEFQKAESLIEEKMLRWIELMERDEARTE